MKINSFLVKAKRFSSKNNKSIVRAAIITISYMKIYLMNFREVVSKVFFAKRKPCGNGFHYHMVCEKSKTQGKVPKHAVISQYFLMVENCIAKTLPEKSYAGQSFDKICDNLMFF